MLQLGHVLLGRGLFGERPGQHELGFEHRPGCLDHAVEGCGHPSQDRMLDLALDVCNHLAGIALEPASVKLFGGRPKLDDEVVGEILGFDLAALLAPEAEEGCLIVSHNDPGIRAADKGVSR